MAACMLGCKVHCCAEDSLRNSAKKSHLVLWRCILGSAAGAADLGQGVMLVLQHLDLLLQCDQVIVKMNLGSFMLCIGS